MVFNEQTSWQYLTAFASVLTTLVILVWWAATTFFRKAEAYDLEKRMDTKIDRVEANVSALRSDTSRIASDVSYIRGRITNDRDG